SLTTPVTSATSSPVSMYTPAPPLPFQISPPSPAIVSSLPSPSLGTPPPTPPLIGYSGESTEIVDCSLTISPSTLVVRITNWTLEPMCYALSDLGGHCHIKLPLIVYKPPDNVSISFVNHTGPMFEGHQYTLQCTVHDVAPVENLTVTFYRGQTALGKVQLNNSTTKEPVTDIFTFNITPNKNDDGAQYWCEAELQLGSEGPGHPPVVKSHKITASVRFGPQLVCSPKLQVREGESLSCEVRGNPQPSVTWYRDGQVVALPTHSSRKHAGKYIVIAQGPHGQRNFTVEVEVLSGSGDTTHGDREHISSTEPQLVSAEEKSN
ncbi:hypothetical protein GBF38_003150, partial [Nibea albiflora]